MNIGFISTRFHGTDGVSLEAAKWVEVLERDLGHTAFWFAGKLDTPEDRSYLCDKAFFEHPDVYMIQRTLFGLQFERPPEITSYVTRIKNDLKAHLKAFIDQFNIDLIVPQNILAIPMNIPLGLALAELIEETKIPTIAHHHDFAWERVRFQHTAAEDYLKYAFPPALTDHFSHVVINSKAVQDIGSHRQVPATVVPNVFDFENPPPAPDDYADDFRAEFDIAEDEKLILQPTRIVPRKGIESAIDFVARLHRKGIKACLVISHLAGDEGYEYLDSLKRLANQTGVRLHRIGDRVAEHRSTNEDGKKIYTLWDIYPHADFVTYPSLYEGFGNAFLETLYFRKPILVNRYAVYRADIEPLGFKAITMDGILTDEAIDEAAALMADPEKQAEWAEHNYQLSLQHFSYAALRDKLELCITEALTPTPSATS
ncbi:MAG: glycosyltransferase family 4 protein [Verrucomicrobiota bacterium]